MIVAYSVRLALLQEAWRRAIPILEFCVKLLPLWAQCEVELLVVLHLHFDVDLEDPTLVKELVDLFLLVGRVLGYMNMVHGLSHQRGVFVVELVGVLL